MKKLTLLLIAILLTVNAVGIIRIDITQATTPVNGIINSDTTWTKTNSPFSLTGNLLVNDDVTLTIETGAALNLNSYYIRVNGTLVIEPGVTVNMGTYNSYIQVNGVLSARGISTNPIQINGVIGYTASVGQASYSLIIFSQSSLGWNEQTASGCIIENAIINSTVISASNSVKISNDTLFGGVLYFSGGSPIIMNNDIMADIDLNGGSPAVSNNNINQGSISVSNNAGGIATITDNVISNAKTSVGLTLAGIKLGTLGTNGLVVIERNLITNSFEGLEVGNPNVLKSGSIIQNNTIINNAVGISVINRYTPAIANNNIFNNTNNMKLSQLASNNIDATNNWWGTTDQQSINQSIYDSKNDFNLGTVNFVPFFTSANLQAMPYINSPSPTPNPSSSPLSTPSVPEFPLVIIVTTLFLIVSILMVVHKNKSFIFSKIPKK